MLFVRVRRKVRKIGGVEEEKPGQIVRYRGVSFSFKSCVCYSMDGFESVYQVTCHTSGGGDQGYILHYTFIEVILVKW